jgi:hypothetical protein
MFVPWPLLAINITQCQQIEAAPDINYCRSDLPLFCAHAFSVSRFISLVISGAPHSVLLLNLFLAVAIRFDSTRRLELDKSAVFNKMCGFKLN